MIQQIIDNFYSKERVTDTDFLKAVYELHKNYFIVRPSMSSQVTKFIKNFNEACAPHHIKLSTFKNTPPGFTVEEMLLKALAFNRDNPLEFMEDHALFIPKTKIVFEYLDSIKTFNILLGNNNEKESISNKVKLFTSHSQGRILKRFYKYVSENYKNFINMHNRFPEAVDGKIWIPFDVVYDVEREFLKHSESSKYTYKLDDNQYYFNKFINDIQDFIFDVDKNKNPSFEAVEKNVKNFKYNSSKVEIKADIGYCEEISRHSSANAKMLKALGLKYKNVSPRNKGNCEIEFSGVECGVWINEENFYRVAFQ